LALFGSPVPAVAHGSLAGCIQHSAYLKVDADHIDLIFELTFFEEPSARERAVMDADTDGRVSRMEVEEYLKQLAPELGKRVSLRVAGRDVRLFPLYEPQIQLGSERTHALAQHRLRLSFFAITPPQLQTNAEILVEERLWEETKSLETRRAEGVDGCQLMPEISIPSGDAPQSLRVPHRFKFRCLKPPSSKPARSPTQIPRSAASRLFTP
jgi:hypothetical protein